MSSIRAKNTGPEKKLILMLKNADIKGFGLHRKDLPGKPDFSFEKKKVVIFLNGCFWHRCPFCKKSLPKTHRSFWRKKFKVNVARDKRKNRELRLLGWKTITIWECQLDKKPVLVLKKIKRGLDLFKKVP